MIESLHVSMRKQNSKSCKAWEILAASGFFLLAVSLFSHLNLHIFRCMKLSIIILESFTGDFDPFLFQHSQLQAADEGAAG